MGALSIKRYAVLCVLGGEIFYVFCLFYGTLLSGSAVETHRAMFAVAFPGFVWGSPLSYVIGAVLTAIYAAVFGSFVAWMHNKSLKK